MVTRRTTASTTAKRATRSATKDAKPKRSASTTPLPSRAFEEGGRAWGARFLRPGRALTPELDLAFALGHGAVGIEPVRLLPDLAAGRPVPWKAGEVHRNVALTVLRTGMVVGSPVVPDTDPPDLDAAEARAVVVERLAELSPPFPVFFGAVEAMVGPACALAALVEGLEGSPASLWDTGLLTGVFPVLKGLLLRAPTAATEDGLSRLGALYRSRSSMFAAKDLDILLHGREGIARCGYKYLTQFKRFRTSSGPEPACIDNLLFVDDDEAFVAAQFEALWTALGWRIERHMSGPSPARLFLLGGEAALQTELRVVDRYPGTRQAEALASYTDLRSPTVARLVLRLTRPSSKVQEQAQGWLRAQQEWTRPLLSSWAGGSDDDAALAGELLAADG